MLEVVIKSNDNNLFRKRVGHKELLRFVWNKIIKMGISINQIVKRKSESKLSTESELHKWASNLISTLQSYNSHSVLKKCPEFRKFLVVH